jgi:hypothetical protein
MDKSGDLRLESAGSSKPVAAKGMKHMFVLDDLLIGLPAKGLVGIFKEICDMAQAEFTDEAKIKEELLRIQTLYEIDQISEEEYQKQEAALLERLMIARESEQV